MRRRREGGRRGVVRIGSIWRLLGAVRCAVCDDGTDRPGDRLGRFCSRRRLRGAAEVRIDAGGVDFSGLPAALVISGNVCDFFGRDISGMVQALNFLFLIRVSGRQSR